MTASGRTAALLTLGVLDVRPVAADDLVSVRSEAVAAPRQSDGYYPESGVKG
jgi:hypothetical protein